MTLLEQLMKFLLAWFVEHLFVINIYGKHVCSRPDSLKFCNRFLTYQLMESDTLLCEKGQCVHNHAAMNPFRMRGLPPDWALLRAACPACDFTHPAKFYRSASSSLHLKQLVPQRALLPGLGAVGHCHTLIRRLSPRLPAVGCRTAA